MIEAVVGNAVRFLDKINENLMKILNTLPRPVFARARAASHYPVPWSRPAHDLSVPHALTWLLHR
jgi:hypothetical protein